MNEVYEISLLLDFYGQLITERQYELLDLHYNNDYSLGEIAEHMNISRQGVYDNIRRGKLLLNEFEKKLGLVSKFSEQKKAIENILEELGSIEYSKLTDIDRTRFENVQKSLQLIIRKL